MIPDRGGFIGYKLLHLIIDLLQNSARLEVSMKTVAVVVVARSLVRGGGGPLLRPRCLSLIMIHAILNSTPLRDHIRASSSLPSQLSCLFTYNEYLPAQHTVQ